MDSVVEVGRIRFEVSSVSEVGWLSSVGGVPVGGVPVGGVSVGGVPVGGVSVGGVPVEGVPVEGVPVEGVPVEGVSVEGGVPVDVVGVVTSEVLLPEMEVTIIIRDE